MKNLMPLFAALCFLSACGDPLEDVDKLSAVELAEDAGSVAALPDPAETARQGGLFSGLFGNRQSEPSLSETTSTDDAVNAALLGEAVDGAEQVALAAAEPAPKRRGLFGLFAAREPAQPVAVEAAPVTEAIEAAEILAVAEPETTLAPSPATPEAEPRPRRGLFGRLAGARANEQRESAPEVAVRTASIGNIIPPRETKPKQSLFKPNPRKHKGPDAQIVSFGTTLPQGVVARVCDLPAGRLGKQIEKFPARGQGYKLIDSKPGSTAKRPFYVTGFDDNCARTFTAALALFGSPTMHEQLRYGLPSKVQPYSLTDQAYEGIKRSVCGVGKQKACGPKISKLEKNTVFVSIYDRIGSNATWSNILIHDGWVLATDRKG